jgi:hypothetical protein
MNLFFFSFFHILKSVTEFSILRFQRVVTRGGAKWSGKEGGRSQAKREGFGTEQPFALREPQLGNNVRLLVGGGSACQMAQFGARNDSVAKRRLQINSLRREYFQEGLVVEVSSKPDA